MVFEGQNAGYEVIQALSEAGGNLHYRCRRSGGEELCHLAAAPLGEDILSRVAVWQENPAFGDLWDYFIWEDRICLVFPDLDGSVLGDVLAAMTPIQRFSVGQQVMEQFLIQDLPLCLQWELAWPEAIYVKEDGTKPQFFYLSQPAAEYKKATEGSAMDRLYGLFGALFSEEIREKYPETEDFLHQGKEREGLELMEVYTKYLGLLPVFSRAVEAEENEKEPLGERIKRLWKKWSKILLTAVKVGLGVLTLCAALILLPQVWAEKIKPVIDGAVLWKQVYVDGETLPGSEEPLPSEEDEGDESGDGRRTIYWEQGGIRYQGGMQDELYEGTGTLYYADGTIEYQGGFSFGKREGEGISYTETGQILYEGQFGNDRYEGEGRLYDRESGSLVYEGGFQSGKYSGEGTLYQPLSEFPLYVGGFRLGHYDGKGLQYDENGCMLYEGDFLLGVYHGNGTIYDSETGVILFTGAFRNGMPVLVEEDGMLDGELGEVGEGALAGGLDEARAGALAGVTGEAGDGMLAEELGEAGDGALAGEPGEVGTEMSTGGLDAIREGAPESKIQTEDAPADGGKSPVVGPPGGVIPSEGGPGT